MKNLKFRAWNKKLQTLCDVSTLASNAVMVVRNGEMCEWRLEDVEIMQATGFQDTNGIDIYEGDIVKYYIGWMKESSDKPVDGIEETKVVAFLNGAFVVTEKDNDQIWNYVSNLVGSVFKMKVVGNGYQQEEK